MKNNIGQWENEYMNGRWDYLDTAPESNRYTVIANCINQFSPDGKILDLGSGEGILLKYIPPSRDYTGIDFSKTALKSPNYNRQNSTSHCSSIEEFQPKEDYSVCIFNEVLYYANNPIDEIYRYSNYLSDNGVFIISMWDPPKTQVTRHSLIHGIWQEIERQPHIELSKISIIDHTHSREWLVKVLQLAKKGIPQLD